jgi:hypothetical protein
MKQKQICKVEGCTNIYEAKGYCKKHYIQICRHGHILERTIYDSNEIILDYRNNCAYIILYNKQQQEVAKAIIDIEDINKIKKYKWCFSKNNRVSTKINNHTLYLHQLIMNTKGIDHINGNPLDNRKSNLRKCTHQQNRMNNKIFKNNTSGYKGIYFVYNKYSVQICVNYKQIYLGLFKKLEDAIEARQKAEIKYFGDYRRKN